jgi:flagellar motor switch protein FliM
VTLDPALLFAALEIMLGAADQTDAPAAGDSADDPPPTWAPRAFTTIEKRLGAQLVGLALREVAAAFAPLAAVTFTPGAIESGPADVLFTPVGAGCLRVLIRLTLGGRGGHLCLIMPHRTLDPVRALLVQPAIDGPLGGDPGWKDKLLRSLNDTPVTLTAILHEQVVPLSSMLGWRPGDVLDLGIDSTDEVVVSCSGKTMFRAATGRRKNGAVALRVTTDPHDTPEEAANGFAD